MARTLHGKITFANEVPAAGVEVRVFDQDAPGKADDDLTLTAGLSDERGQFSVAYDPGRFRDITTDTRAEPRDPPFDWTLVRREHQRSDWSDIFRPYLRFSYSFQGEPRQCQAPLNWFSTTYTLPQVLTPLPFTPSLHGYRFVNLFKGAALPFSIPEIPGLIRISGTYGLCGGMAASAYDHYLYGRQIPQRTGVPRAGTALQRYLYRRQMDSFGTLGEYILKFARWMKTPDDTRDGLLALTWSEFQQLRTRLRDNQASILGLIYAKGGKLSGLFLNHQVLAYALETADEEHFTIRIYDPNHPGRDDVAIRAERRSVADEAGQPVDSLFCEQWLGEQKTHPIYGFFLMPYIPIRPPVRLR